MSSTSESGADVATSDFEPHAREAAEFLRALGNEHRLLILCHLLTCDELSVNALVARVGLSQSALSQHLARLRQERLVSFRRESQTLYYRIRDARTVRMLSLLSEMFCPTSV